MTTQINQTVIYTPPATGLTSSTVLVQNTSGLGPSQNFVATSPAGVPINSTLCYSVQAPRPAPIWYIATAAITTTFSVFTIENNPITLTDFTPTIGFNGGFFQPNPGQKFNIFVKNAAILAPAASVFFIQAVVENTLSQYIDYGSINYEHEDKCRMKPCSRNIVTGNAISAIPNTIAFDFWEYPVPHTENSLVRFKGLLNAQAILSYGSAGSVAGNSVTQQYVVIGGQVGAITYPGGRGMTFTGTVFLLLNNIGNVSLPPTVTVPSMSTQFDETNFALAVGGTATENADSSMISLILGKVNDLAIPMSHNREPEQMAFELFVTSLSKKFDDLAVKNDKMHSFQNNMLTSIMAKLGDSRD